MFGSKPKELFCLRCQTKGIPKNYTPGNFGLELFAWLLFALPGLIYTIWRKAASYQGCPTCGAKELVPVDSPVAKRVLTA